jgi:DNA polymerase III subunit delta
MEIKAAQAPVQLRRILQDVLIVLLHGPDAGLVSELARLTVSLSGVTPDDPFAVTRIDAESGLSEPGRLVDEARSISMFGGKRVILVTLGSRSIQPQIEILLESPPPDTLLVLIAGELRGGHALRTLCEASRQAVSIACYGDESKSVDQIISEMFAGSSVRLGAEARELLNDKLGRDRALTRGEIEKLLLFADDLQEITTEDIDAIIADSAGIEPSTAIDNAFSGQVAEVETEANRAFRDGLDAGVLIGFAERHVQALLAIDDLNRDGVALKDAMRRQGVHFRREAAVLEHRRLWTTDKLLSASQMLRQSLLQSRTQSALGEAIAIRALWSIALQIRR